MILSPSAFKNPINQTKSTDAADAFDKPILTLASLRRGVTNVQTNGLPTDNKTSLGLYRFPGNDIGALSGGIGQPAVPPVAPVFKPNAVSFVAVGNNVVQPSGSTTATNALLKRLGDQQFKAKENEPYAAYMAMAKLEREVAEAEKGASVGDLNLAREILRSAMAERRKQNEDDYLRRMLDSGMTAEDAQDEINELRRANALQEARKVEDRSYQSKLLLVNLAKKRGIPSVINEPLTQSAPIMNPAPSDALATTMGDASQGFGNAPLDVNRAFLTPEYYGRFLRRTRQTEEEVDRQTAFNNLVAQGVETQTPLMLQGKRREIAMENAAENLASSLSSIRRRALVEPLPPAIFAKAIYKRILEDGIGKKPLQGARMVERTFDEMTTPQLVVAVNRILVETPEYISLMKTAISEALVKETYDKNDLIRFATTITGKDSGKTVAISVPFRINNEQITQAIREYRVIVPDAERRMARQWLEIWEEMVANLDAEPERAGKPESDTKKNLYFANTGAVRSPEQQISEDYGVSASDARKFAGTIAQARREQLDARDANEQEKLSKARAVKLLREFAAKKKADRNAREMEEVEQMEGAVASMTRAKRLPPPRRGGKTTVTFSRPAADEMRVTGPSPAAQIEKSRRSRLPPVPSTKSMYDKLTATEKDALADAYGVSKSKTRSEQYAELKNI